MTTVILVGDLHLRDTPPVSCTPGYTEDILAMLGWIAALETEISADAVVQAGDVFDFKAPAKTSHALILRVIETFGRFKNLWIVPGNHDMSSDRLESVFEKQPLGVVLAAGAARTLNGWHPTLPVYGVPWQQDWTTNPGAPERAFSAWRLDPWRFEKDADARDRSNCLAVMHAPVYPPALAEKVLFDLVPTGGPLGLAAAMGGAGYGYYGHIHSDDGQFTDDGVTFANVGALSRGSRTDYNLIRKIKIMVWTDTPFYGAGHVTGDYSFEVGFTEIEIPHKPSSEVFTEVDEVAKAEGLDLEAFLASVGSASLEVSSTASVVAHLRGMSEVDEVVRERAVGFIEDVDS